MTKSCVITATCVSDKIQSLAANIRTLEDCNSPVAGRLALELVDEISAYVKSFKNDL